MGNDDLFGKLLRSTVPLDWGVVALEKALPVKETPSSAFSVCKDIQPLQDTANWNPLKPFFIDPDMSPIGDFTSHFNQLLNEADISCRYARYQHLLTQQVDAVSHGKKDASLDAQLGSETFELNRLFDDIEHALIKTKGTALSEGEYWTMLETVEARGIDFNTSHYLFAIETLRKDAATQPHVSKTTQSIEALTPQYEQIITTGREHWEKYQELVQEHFLQTGILTEMEEEQQQSFAATTSGTIDTAAGTQLVENVNAASGPIERQKAKIEKIQTELAALEAGIAEVEDSERKMSGAIIESLVRDAGIEGLSKSITDTKQRIALSKELIGCFVKDVASNDFVCKDTLQQQLEYPKSYYEATLAEQETELTQLKSQLVTNAGDVKTKLVAIRLAAFGPAAEGSDPIKSDILFSAFDHAQLADALSNAGAKDVASDEYKMASKTAGSQAEKLLYTVMSIQMRPEELKEQTSILQGLAAGIASLRAQAANWTPENTDHCIQSSEFPCAVPPGTPAQVEVLNAVLWGTIYDSLLMQKPEKEEGVAALNQQLDAMETDLLKVIHKRTLDTTPLESVVLLENTNKVMLRNTSKGGRIAQLKGAVDLKTANSKLQDMWIFADACENMITPLARTPGSETLQNLVLGLKWHAFFDGKSNGLGLPLMALKDVEIRIFNQYPDSKVVKSLLRELKMSHSQMVTAGKPNTAVDVSYSAKGREAARFALGGELVTSENLSTADKAGMGAGLGVGLVAAIMSDGLAIPFLLGGGFGAGTYAGTDYYVAKKSPQYSEAMKTGYSLGSVLEYNENMGTLGMATFFAGLESAMWWTPIGKVSGVVGKKVVTGGLPILFASTRTAFAAAKELGVRGTAAYLGTRAIGAGAEVIGGIGSTARSLTGLRMSSLKPASEWIKTRGASWWQKASISARGLKPSNLFSPNNRWTTARWLTAGMLTAADYYAIEDISINKDNGIDIKWGTDKKINTVVGLAGGLMLISEGAMALFNMPVGGTYVTAGFRAGTEQTMLLQQGQYMRVIDPSRLVFGVLESRTVEFFIASFIRGEEYLKGFGIGRAMLAAGKFVERKAPGISDTVFKALVNRGQKRIVGWTPKKEKAQEVRSVTIVRGDKELGYGRIVSEDASGAVKVLFDKTEVSGQYVMEGGKKFRPHADKKTRFKIELSDGRTLNATRYHSGAEMSDKVKTFFASRGIYVRPDNRMFALNGAKTYWPEPNQGFKMKYQVETVTINANDVGAITSATPLPTKLPVGVIRNGDGSLTLTQKLTPSAMDKLPKGIHDHLLENGVKFDKSVGLHTEGWQQPGNNGLTYTFVSGKPVDYEVEVAKPLYESTVPAGGGRRVTSIAEVEQSQRAIIIQDLSKRGIYVDEVTGRFYSIGESQAMVLSGDKVDLDKSRNFKQWITRKTPEIGNYPKMMTQNIPLESVVIGNNPYPVRRSGVIPIYTRGRDGKYNFTVEGSSMMFAYVAPIVWFWNFEVFAPAQNGDPNYQTNQRLANYAITLAFTWPLIQWPLGFFTKEAELAGRLVGIPVNIFANRVYPNKRDQVPGWQRFYDDVEKKDFSAAVYGNDLGITQFGGLLQNMTSLTPANFWSVEGDHGEAIIEQFEEPAIRTWRKKMDEIIKGAFENYTVDGSRAASTPQVRWLKNFAVMFDTLYQKSVTDDAATTDRRMVRIMTAYIKGTLAQRDPQKNNPALEPFRALVIKYPEMFNLTPTLTSEKNWIEFVAKVNLGKDPASNTHLE